MKTNFLFLCLLLLGFITNAQKTPPIKKQGTVSKKDIEPRTFNVVTPNNFESGIVQGKLIFNRKLIKQNNSNTYTPTYNIVSSFEKSNLKDKPLEITLSRVFFESVFLTSSPEISERSDLLKKYILDKNITLQDENGWMDLIKYFNSL